MKKEAFQRLKVFLEIYLRCTFKFHSPDGAWRRQCSTTVHLVPPVAGVCDVHLLAQHHPPLLPHHGGRLHVRDPAHWGPGGTLGGDSFQQLRLAMNDCSLINFTIYISFIFEKDRLLLHIFSFPNLVKFETHSENIENYHNY